MNIFDKAIKQAHRANQREKVPVFLHCTYQGIVMKYQHVGVIAQPTYMVTKGKVYDVTYNLDNDAMARCYRYDYLHDVA